MIYNGEINKTLTRSSIKKISIVILFTITMSTALVSSLKAETAMAELNSFNLDALEKDAQIKQLLANYEQDFKKINEEMNEHFGQFMKMLEKF